MRMSSAPAEAPPLSGTFRRLSAAHAEKDPTARNHTHAQVSTRANSLSTR